MRYASKSFCRAARLQAISNRGIALEPSHASNRYLLNWFRARYVSDTPLSEAEIGALLETLAPRLHWTTLQRLYRTRDGVNLFSPIQQEE